MSENLDLFGEPYAPNMQKRGRPPHVPTLKTANKVKLLLAVGWSNERIAGAIGIALPTLRKHYSSELKAREMMRDRLEARRLEVCVDQANAGNVGAMRLLSQLLDRQDAMGASDRVGARQSEPKGEKLGKKEERQNAARGITGKFAPPAPPRMHS